MLSVTSRHCVKTGRSMVEILSLSDSPIPVTNFRQDQRSLKSEHLMRFPSRSPECDRPKQCRWDAVLLCRQLVLCYKSTDDECCYKLAADFLYRICRLHFYIKYFLLARFSITGTCLLNALIYAIVRSSVRHTGGSINKKAVLSQRWPRDAHYISRSWAVADIWPFKIVQDCGGRHLEFVRIENSAIRSAVPENPIL